jgi:hypothetical protein
MQELGTEPRQTGRPAQVALGQQTQIIYEGIPDIGTALGQPGGSREIFVIGDGKVEFKKPLSSARQRQ